MRQFIRHPTNIPIEYWVANQPLGWRECLKDVSQGGLCFHTECALERGNRIRIMIPIREPAFEAAGTVVWCRRCDSCYEVGVQFADTDTAFSVRMVEQVCHIRAYQQEVWAKEGRQLSSAEAAAEWVGKYAQDFPT